MLTQNLSSYTTQRYRHNATQRYRHRHNDTDRHNSKDKNDNTDTNSCSDCSTTNDCHNRIATSSRKYKRHKRLHINPTVLTQLSTPPQHYHRHVTGRSHHIVDGNTAKLRTRHERCPCNPQHCHCTMTYSIPGYGTRLRHHTTAPGYGTQRSLIRRHWHFDNVIILAQQNTLR